jgi:hypothetical protein
MRKFDFVKHMSASIERLHREQPDMANYQANLKHNVGRHAGWNIWKCEVDGEMWYCAACCRNASRNLSAVRAVCTRNAII